MEYFAALKTEEGLNALPYNPCNLLGFDLLVLSDGEQHASQTGEREVVAVILGGKATFDVGGKRFEKIGGRPNVFGGKPHAVYLPAGVEYAVTADGSVQVALTSAPSDLETEPYVIDPSHVTSGVWGAANFRRYFNQILTLAGQPDLPARRLIVGETFTPSRMTQLVRTYVSQAELGKRGACHLWRHTMATAMLENGADIRFIQAMLGHVLLSTTQLYTQVSIRKLKQIHTATHPAATLDREHQVVVDDGDDDHATVDDLLGDLDAEAEDDSPDGP